MVSSSVPCTESAVIILMEKADLMTAVAGDNEWPVCMTNTVLSGRERMQETSMARKKCHGRASIGM